MLDKKHILNRFIGYVKIDTESDPNSISTPSTEKQWDLAHKLADELKSIGMQDVSIDANAYIMATLPSNVTHTVPTIGFVSHFDTSPDFTAKNVNPQIIENYDGSDIVLNEKENIILSPDYFEDLLLYKGQTLITTDGTTLLGADDKAGVCEIVSAMEYLIQHPEIKHGTIKVGLPLTKKLAVELINLMSKNLELTGLTPWMEVKSESLNMKILMQQVLLLM